MLENIDSTIKKYVEETEGPETADGDVDMAETRRLDDGRVVTKDGKILRKARINNQKSVVYFCIAPTKWSNGARLGPEYSRKYGFTSLQWKMY